MLSKLNVNKTIVICTLLLLTSRCYSQSLNSEKEKLKTFIGCQIGLTTAAMYGGSIDSQVKYDGKYLRAVGTESGLRVVREINSRCYIRTGISFYQRDGYVRGGHVVSKIKGPFNFLQFPIIIGVQQKEISNSNGARLGFESGFSINHLIDSSIDLEEGLSPNHEFSYILNVPAFNCGFNYESSIGERINCFVSYNYTLDLTYYFRRRLFKYDHDLQMIQENEYKDYHLRFRSGSLTFGVMYKI
jgi:hypothetical protein